MDSPSGRHTRAAAEAMGKSNMARDLPVSFLLPCT